MQRLLTYFCLFLSLMMTSAVFAEDSVVKSESLPVDSDGDGVLDLEDECSFTEDGAKVDERGCYIIVQDKKRIRVNINFEYDSSKIDGSFASNVKEVADFMSAHPLTRVVFEGHTDSDGPKAYNVDLSQRRATAAAKMLVADYGIAASRVTAVGFGESKPLAKNESQSNKRLNRRVVAVIATVDEQRL